MSSKKAESKITLKIVETQPRHSNISFLASELYNELIKSADWKALSSDETDAFEKAAPDGFKLCELRVKSSKASGKHFVVLFRGPWIKSEQKLDSYNRTIQADFVTEVHVLDASFHVVERFPVVEKFSFVMTPTAFCVPYLEAFAAVHKKYFVS